MFRPKSAEDEACAITGLVDDSLSASERADVEAWAREHENIARQVDAQRQVSAALRDSGPDAPPMLVTQIRDRVTGAYGDHAAKQTRRRQAFTGWRPLIPVAAAGVAALVVAIVLIAGGGSGGPSIEHAAQLAFAPSTQPAPGVQSPRYLDVSYGGVTFPNYVRAFGAVPTGQRFDRIGGRPALTVFYRLSNGTRVSYTVFSGKPVPLPQGTQEVVYEHVRLHSFVSGSKLAVVTLVRHGRTCVLAAMTPPSQVIALAEEPLRAQAI
jgi:hypothetical protein